MVAIWLVGWVRASGCKIWPVAMAKTVRIVSSMSNPRRIELKLLLFLKAPYAPDRVYVDAGSAGGAAAYL